MQLSSLGSSPVPQQQARAAGGGTQGFVADVLRGTGAGYAAATNQAGTTADQAMIHPIESVYTGVSLLADKTKNVKGLNKVTGLVKTAATFGLLIVGMQASSMLKAPGATAVDLTHGVADMIDGKKTRDGLNTGIAGTVDADGDGKPDSQAAPTTGIGGMLAGLGVGQQK